MVSSECGEPGSLVGARIKLRERAFVVCQTERFADRYDRHHHPRR